MTILKKRKIEMEDNIKFLIKESDKNAEKADSVTGLKEQ